MKPYPFTPKEFFSWPLVHGCLGLETKIDSIRRSGLLPARMFFKETNSFDYDIALGRTDYIFAELITIRSKYGMGNCVLIDPKVLTFSSVKCSFYDVGDILKQVERLVEDSDYALPYWIIAPEELFALVQFASSQATRELHEKNVSEEHRFLFLPKITERFLIKDIRFHSYVKSYFSAPEEFFRELVRRLSDQHGSIEDFVQRTIFGLPEEILIKDQVSTDYILGFRLNGKWIPESEPSTEDVAERLARLKTLWK